MVVSGRRRKYYINKDIQLKYIFLVLGLLTVYTLFLLGAIFGPYFAVMVTDTDVMAKTEAASFLLLLHGKIWPGIAMVIILFSIYSIFITHKIVGPIFVIERTAREIADGNLSVRVNLRKGDDLHQLAECFNSMADKQEALLIQLNKEYGQLSAYIKDLERELAECDDTHKILEQLSSQIESDKNAIGDILGQYTFGKESRRV
jgi:methyl-accepting chemotaxis protein